MKKCLMILLICFSIFATETVIFTHNPNPCLSAAIENIGFGSDNSNKTFSIIETMETDSVEFYYSTTPGSYISTVSGDIEANRFTPEHPCSIYEVSAYLTDAPGSFTQIHIWGDWGGNPDVSNDYMIPANLYSDAVGGWMSFNIESSYGRKVYIPPMTDVHLGRIAYSSMPYMYYGNRDVGAPIAHYYSSADDTWYYVGADDEYYAYMIRMKGIYFDIDTIKSFIDIADSAGLTDGGRTVAFGDINNDGYDDLACSGLLYINNSGEYFEYSGFSFGGSASFGDFDGDGWLDAVKGTTPLKLWRNNTDGTFTDVTAEYGFIDYTDRKNCAGFGDFDGDGWLDLYVSYSEDWNDGDPIYYRDHTYINQAGTLFVENTDEMPSLVSEQRYSRGIHFCDFDVDGDQDIYISRYRLHSNILLVNNGDGTFDEMAGDYNVRGHLIDGAYGHTIGSKWCDFDNDGDFDLICANLAHPRFIDFSDKTYIYRNNGDGTFTDIFDDSGISYYETHSNPTVGDYDNDGNLDLYITCIYEGYRSFIYRGNGDGTFTADDYKTGIMTDNGWGSAFSDYDNDGDLDLVASGRYGLQLWQNQSAAGRNNWVEISAFCDVTTNNFFAYGTQVRIYLRDGRILSRCIQGNTGLEGCMDSRIMHFGCGSETIADSIIVLYPGLTRVSWTDVNLRKKHYTVYESGAIEDITETPGMTTEPSKLNLQAYPNPFNSSVSIANISGKIRIVDINGKTICYINTNKHGKNATVKWIPEANVKSGIYFAITNTQAGKSITRLVYIK